MPNPEDDIAKTYSAIRSKVNHNDEMGDALEAWNDRMAKCIACLREWYVLNKLMEFRKVMEGNPTMVRFIDQAEKQTQDVLIELGAISPPLEETVDKTT